MRSPVPVRLLCWAEGVFVRCDLTVPNHLQLFAMVHDSMQYEQEGRNVATEEASCRIRVAFDLSLCLGGKLGIMQESTALK